jgi:hypothetical protein
MNSKFLAAFATMSLTAAMAPVASAQAEPAPSTLEQVVHADARITHGGAIAGDSVPFSVFEHTDISAADILNRQELYHVSPDVAPAAPGYGTGAIVAQTAHHPATGTRIAQSGHARTG